jgi:hypothetical protein
MTTGMTTSTATADSALGTLTTGTAARSQVTTGASQFSEVSSIVIWRRKYQLILITSTQLDPSETDGTGTQHFVLCSKVSLAQGLVVNFKLWPFMIKQDHG